MGPLELLYSWQAVLCATACIGITQLVKTIVDVVWGKAAPEDTSNVKEMAKVGKDKRKGSVIINRFVLPMSPIIVGFGYAVLVPLLPDVLTGYIRDNALEGVGLVMAKGAWGGACGQFSNYIFDRVKKTWETMRS